MMFMISRRCLVFLSAGLLISILTVGRHLDAKKVVLETGDSAKQPAHTYSVPTGQLDKNTTSFRITQYYHERDNKYRASVRIGCREDKEHRSTYVELSQIELITRGVSENTKRVAPIQMRKASYSEHDGLGVDFDYSVDNELFETASLRFHLLVRSVGESKNIKYEINLADLEESVIAF